MFVKHPPQDSALVRETDPDHWITPEIQMLREVHQELQVLLWRQTADAQANPPRGYPDRLPLSVADRAEYDAAHAPEYDAMTLAEAADFLGWDRELKTKEA